MQMYSTNCKYKRELLQNVATTNIQITVQVAHNRQTEIEWKHEEVPRRKSARAKTELERQSGR